MYACAVDYRDEAGEVWASAEKLPGPEGGMIVWHEQWYDHPKGEMFVTHRFREWAATNGIKYQLAKGR